MNQTFEHGSTFWGDFINTSHSNTRHNYNKKKSMNHLNKIIGYLYKMTNTNILTTHSHDVRFYFNQFTLYVYLANIWFISDYINHNSITFCTKVMDQLEHRPRHSQISIIDLLTICHQYSCFTNDKKQSKRIQLSLF